MSTAATPIRRKLMTIVLLTSGVVLLITTVASFAYEFLTYRTIGDAAISRRSARSSPPTARRRSRSRTRRTRE